MVSAQPGGTSRDGGGGNSTARENAGSSNGPRTRASVSASATRNNVNKTVIDSPRSLAPGGPEVLSLRRASRNAPTPSRDRCPTRIGNVIAPYSDRQQKRAAEEPWHGAPKMLKNSASNSLSRDSDRISSPTTSCKKGAEERMSEHDSTGNVRSSSKKRKRMDSRTYLRQFRPDVKVKAAVIGSPCVETHDVVVATPGRVGKENTSSGHVADSNIAMLCENNRLIEKDRRHSSDSVCKVSKRPISGLHETSETRVGQCTASFSEVQPHKPTDMCPQNRTTESSLAVEAGDQPAGSTRQSCISSLQSVPISPIHYEEPKSTLGNGEPISVHKVDSASRRFKVTPSDETDGNSNICVACGTPGTLRSCDGKGCKSRYHISCLDPSLENLSPEIWFCTSCTKKRFQFGLHSIIDGIESVWDVKEADGMQNGKQYFVKYKNLAHVHNRWVPEGDITDVTPRGPDLLSLFNKRDNTEKTIWKQEWTKPHRMLRKRLLMPPKLADDFFSSVGANFPYCNVEWLVKWRGLGYDHATWELETLPCLHTSEADELKRNYENRCEVAKQSSIPTKAKKVKQSPFQKLERLPDGCHPDFDNDHLCSINRLREFWHKSHGAVLVDDKERIIKTILFTMAVSPDVHQPFLIVTTPAFLSLWEVQFSNLAPFINVVVYDGGKDNLKLIQDLEFYENGSCIMLQVLLSHPDAILEDIEPIARIGWEAIIVDYYQNSALKYLEQLKQLSTDFRVLLLSSPIKDNFSEYMKLLAFLSPGEQEKDNYVDTADALVISKVKFTRHIAYERQADPSIFLEHWVPAHISQLQLHIYCSILLSNSSVLLAQMKTDSVGALWDILMSLSKCCDDPYLVHEFLLNSPVNNHDRTETIETRVHACGKLLLLDKMLEEIRNKRLRVIILFQSDRAGGNPVGDILEGIVRHRFGPKSYERVEHGAPIARKQAAVNTFNDNTKGRFVFLIENHACLPSIELSSVDATIIYNSDWNPLNDLEALQRIKIESQLKNVSIFRLYTPFTVEEKRLVLAKQGMHIHNDIQDIVRSLSHSLISWGASFLFTRFDELQQDNYASKSSERDTHFMDKVISEFLTKLPTNVENSTDMNSAAISRANMSGNFYSRSITLIGEKEGMPLPDGDPPKFWLNLLDGKSPCWSYISEPPQSSQRMLQNTEEPAKVPAEEADDARRKCGKVGEIMGPSSKSLSDSSHDDMLPENCTTSSPVLQPLDDTQQKLGLKKLMSTPKNLHIKLKQELSKLIKVLQLPDNVRFMAERFLEYVLKNHLVVQEPIHILHAFNIALCWRAASLLHYKVDRRESLALAEKCLNYEYNDELAGLIYGKLRILKKKFPRRAGETSIKCQPCTDLGNDHMSQKQKMDLHGNCTNGSPKEGSSCAEQMVSEGQELISVEEAHRECHLSNDDLPKQQLEISGLETHTQNKVIRLKEVCNLVLEHIRRSHIDEMTRNDKIKLTVEWFTVLLYAFLEHMRLQHDKLEARQSNTWSAERQLKENLHQEAKSDQLVHDFDQHIALPDSTFAMEEFIHFKEQNDGCRISGSSISNCQRPSNEESLTEIALVQNVIVPEPISTQAVQNERVETFLDSGGGPTSEAIHFPESSLHCSSDGVGLQRAGSSSTIPANDDSVGQESSTGEPRNTEHVDRDNIANASMFLKDATSLVREFNANKEDTLGTDQVQLMSPILASSQSIVALSVSRGVGIHANLSTTSVQQTVGTTQHLPVELESTNSLGAIAAWDLPPQQRLATLGHPPADAEPASTLRSEATQNMQPSATISDAPLQRMHPDHSSQTKHQTETSPGLSQGGGTCCHLGDAKKGVGNKSETVCADQAHLEVPSCAAPQVPAIFAVSGEIETQIDQSSTPARQSTSLPPQQMLATSGHPPADAESASILRTESVQDLQPGLQLIASISDAPLQRMHPDHSNQTGHQRETSLGLSQGGGACRHLRDAREGVDANYCNPVCAHEVHSESSTCAALQISGICAVSGEVGTRDDLSSVTPQQSPYLPAQQTVSPSEHPPSNAEGTGLLGTRVVQDLQPGGQTLTLLSDAPPQRMHPDDRSQTCCQPDRASQGYEATSDHLDDARMQVKVKHDGNIPEDPVHSESPTHTAYNPVNLPVSTEVETQTCQSSMPMEQSTSLPAQQSLATSPHPPTEAELTGIMGMEAARDLQVEVQASSSMQDQPAEAGRASILGAIAARDLQPEMLPSNSTQDVPFERTYPSAVPVLQSLTVHHSVEPSQDPHAGVESSRMLGTVTVHDLQSEIQSSASMQDRPAETEGAGTLGTTATQDLQPEMQSSTAVQHVPLERTISEERRQIGFQPNLTPGAQQPTQLPPVTTLVFNNPILSDEPLKNELDRLIHCNNLLSKAHEQKKSLLLIEYNQEVERVKRKYGSLLQREDSTYRQRETELVDIYRKVFVNQSLAENFRGKFTRSFAGQGRSMNPVMGQPLQSSSAAQTAASSVALLSAIRPPVFHSPRPYVRPSLVTQPSLSRAVQLESISPGIICGSTSSPFIPAPAPHGSYGTAGAQSRAIQPQSILPGNLYRATSSPFIPMPLPHGSHGSAGARSCALAPHLQQLRMQSPYAIDIKQQQPPAGPGVTSLRQFVPGITENFASTSPQAGAILTSITTNPLHQTMPSASSSPAAFSAFSLPSGPHPESMANFVQSSSSNPIFMATQQPSSASIVFHSTSGPLNAAPGSWHGGAQIAGVNQFGSESASLNAWRAAMPGLTSDPAGAVASAEVVCLSDDEL